MHGLPYPDLPKALQPIVSAMPDLIESDEDAAALSAVEQSRERLAKGLHGSV